ncbi:hypothetical protein PF006_g30342 [Phytophthora fragariae]|uniref:Uncharacterized protein n=1 Tax=Phytophthora fragariae TaxID=53985 RepID=A0A6A3Q021_9STRA|nr:hypothetical protein PF006_g30342 [Phytophthora fragariae]
MSSPTTKQTRRQDSDSGDVQPKRRRTTRGSATNVQPPIAYDREEFNCAWRLLRRDKWFSKPPRGLLSDQYRYVPPGGDPDGIAGVDYFLGEQALVEEYNKTIGVVNQTCTIVELDAQAGEAVAVVMNVDRGADAATEDCVSSEKDGLSESTSCAVCSLEYSRDRTCTSCNKFMHHFCSHE